MSDMGFHIGKRVMLSYDGIEDDGHGTIYHIDDDTLFVEMDNGTHETEPADYFEPLDEPDQEPNFYAELDGFYIISERYEASGD